MIQRYDTFLKQTCKTSLDSCAVQVELDYITSWNLPDFQLKIQDGAQLAKLPVKLSQNYLMKKSQGPKHFEFKNFWSKKVLRPQNFAPRKILIPKNFESKNFLI